MSGLSPIRGKIYLVLFFLFGLLAAGRGAAGSERLIVTNHRVNGDNFNSVPRLVSDYGGPEMQGIGRRSVPVVRKQVDNAADSVSRNRLRLIRYGFTLKNSSPKVLARGELWVRAPVAVTSYQKCLTLDASRRFELVRDEAGNQVMRFVFADLSPYAVRIITITARMDLRRRIKDPGAGSGDFLGPERFIETDAPEISGLAAGFKAGDTLVRAKSIYQWVAASLEYTGFSGKEKGALSTLLSRGGDCTEFRDLFVALARAVKIPARRVSGYVVPADMILKPGAWHDWAEFFYQGRWEVADPQKKVFAKREQEYIAFKIFAGESEKNPLFARFKTEGEGLAVRMN